MNLISIFLSLSQIIILVIIFYLIFYYLYPSNNINQTLENFTNSIQHDSYVCKTHHEIFDLFYLDLYKNLYHNPKINYIFQQTLSKSLRKPKPIPKNKNIKQNRGDKTFHLKWGISVRFFKKHFLKSRTIYDGHLKDPNKSFSFFFDLLKCKIKFYYLKLFFKRY